MSTAATPNDSDRRGAVDGPDAHTHTLRRGRLGPFAIAFLVVSAAAPLTGMAGGAPVAMLLGNGPGIPAAYVIVGAIFLVFAVGYVAMARHVTSAGAFYAFVSQGLGQKAGGAAAWIALLGYNTMQIGLYGLFGSAAAGFLKDTFGLDMAWWVPVLVAWVIVGLLGYRQVDLSVKVLSVLVGLEFLIVLVMDVAILVKGGHGGGGGLSMQPFSPSALTGGSLAIALLFNSASFIGFEATTIYSEEAREPRRTVPRATYLAVSTIMIFFAITTWLMVNAQGADTLVSHLGEMKPDPTGFLFEINEKYVGSGLTKVMTLLFVTSVFAALVAFHNAVARYLYALGREGLVPERLGHTHEVHLSPHAGSMSQSVLAIVVLALFIVTKQDPVLALFTWLTQLGTLSILFLMGIASAAVLAFFRRNQGLEPNPLKSLVAPLVGFVALIAVALYAASQFGNLISNPESPLRWILPALILVAALVGVASAVVLQRRSPEQYALMGRHRGDEPESPLPPPLHPSV